jgi:ribose transport system substrate-binding protein
MKRTTSIFAIATLIALAVLSSNGQRPVNAVQVAATATQAAIATAVSTPDAATTVNVSQTDIDQAKSALGSGIVGLISCTQQNQYFVNLLTNVTSTFAASGIKTELFDSQADETRELQGLNDLVNNKNAKALVVCALYNKDFEKALQSASANGIKIVLIEASHDINVPNAVKFVDNNVQLGDTAGRFAGQYILDHMGGKANVAILDYPDQPSIVERANAIARGLCNVAPDACPKDSAGKSIPIPRFKGGAANFGEDSGKAILQKYPNTNVVVSINDAGALGAIKAFAAAGKTPQDIAMVGIDGLPDSLADMANPQGGWFRGTVVLDIPGTAQLTANAIIKLLAGATISTRLQQPLKLVTREEMLAATPAATPQATAAS